MSLSKVITVIPTFFADDNSIDYQSIHEHITDQINYGIKTIVILGTTSEAPTLSESERLEVAHYVYNHFNNLVTIVIGLGGNNTDEMIREITNISPFGNYIMISQPSYNKPSQKGIYEHYKKLIDSTDKNVIIYNIPSRCGVNIEPKTIQEIVSISPQVVAIKEASGSLEQVMNVIELCPNLMVYSGDDMLVLPIMALGGCGVISVVSNIVPSFMIKMLENILNNNDQAMNMFYKIRPLIKYCFVESNPVPLKYVLAIIKNKFSLENVRLPLVELTNESKNKLFDINLNELI
jgi:4-hydroxy-tetrahydrodipicolinate synthase